MSSWIVLDKDYAELKVSDSALDRLRQNMLIIAKRWNVNSESSVINFIELFHGSTYLDIVDDLMNKSEVELFGKLFLAAIKKEDHEMCDTYIPTQAEVDDLIRDYHECYISEFSKHLYDFGNKILEYAAKLED